MNKRYPFSGSTRNLYLFGGGSLLTVGLVLLLVGLAVLFDNSGMRTRSVLHVALLLTGGGILLLSSSAVPLKAFARSRTAQIELTEAALVWSHSEHGCSVAWHDIEDVSDSPTQLFIGLKAGKGTVTIPAEYEDFSDLVASVKEFRRRRTLTNPYLAPEGL
ncbi:MAG: hypothetical protein AB1758_17095 [Candidatus Eremiobacterota bacterium]